MLCGGNRVETAELTLKISNCRLDIAVKQNSIYGAQLYLTFLESASVLST